VLGRPTALVASVAFHAFAIVAGGHAIGEGRATVGAGATPLLVDIDVAPDPVVPSSQGQGESAVEAALAVSHRHRYPVAPSHDARPHDPSIVHAPIAASDATSVAPNVVEASAEAPVRFTLPIGKAVVGAAVGRGSGAEGGDSAVTYAESQVNVPARLLSGAAIDYPPEARAAQIEEDLVVELVVDASGHVAQARSVSNAGHGLDCAAVDSVRRYRFSPALRQGRPVAVRMRWTVQFRLR
jgi:TonB family protein